MSLPWDHPGADPVGDVLRMRDQMKVEHDRMIRTRHHSFNDEGCCVHCDIRWHRAIRTVCDNERVRTLTKVTLMEISVDTTPPLFPDCVVVSIDYPKETNDDVEEG